MPHTLLQDTNPRILAIASKHVGESLARVSKFTSHEGLACSKLKPTTLRVSARSMKIHGC